MDQDMYDKLASGEYSISPRSGRLRKRVRVSKKKSFFKRSKVRKAFGTALWILLLLAFLVSMILVVPEMNLQSDKNKKEQTAPPKQKIR
jgi:hypothetical protein